MHEADSILARYPGPVTLTPSRLKMFALFAASLAIAAGLLWLLLSVRPDDMEEFEKLALWGGAVFAALCAAVFGALTLPGAASLTLAADGFELCNLYRRTRMPWPDTRAFRVKEFTDADGDTDRQVVFEVLGAGSGPERRGAKWYDGMLPDNYRLAKDDLARLMNAWRERALAQQGPGSVPRAGAAGRPP